MTTAPVGEKLLTAEEFLTLCEKGVIKGELVKGVVLETVSAGGEHGEVAAAIATEFRNHIRPRSLGRVATSDSGVRLERDPDTVREPDVAFFSAAKLPLDVRVRGYYEVAPDLVVEIVSPNDSPEYVAERVAMWHSFGVPPGLGGVSRRSYRGGPSAGRHRAPVHGRRHRGRRRRPARLPMLRAGYFRLVIA